MECINKMHRRIIVFGNQKGGTGKSTLAMHLIVSLLFKGYKVATIDADARQGTLTRYIENRNKSRRTNPHILIPYHTPLFESNDDSVSIMRRMNLLVFTELLSSLNPFDYIVIDTPGSDSNLSKIAHSFADVIITPMNESFIDLDLIIKATPASKADGICTSSYAEEVWNQKKERAKRDKGVIDWIILLNRTSSVDSRNKKELEKILELLSKRLGFRLVKGFKERIIFKELFLSGLTLLDSNIAQSQMSLSHIAARQELNNLLMALNIS